MCILLSNIPRCYKISWNFCSNQILFPGVFFLHITFVFHVLLKSEAFRKMMLKYFQKEVLIQVTNHCVPKWRLSCLFFFPSCLPKIRSSITQLLWAGKEFSWWRHCSITISLLAFTNLLVIFVPTIRDIFGFIGKLFLVRSSTLLHFRKSSSSVIITCLWIFISMLFLYRCFCSCHADLYTSFCLLYQISEEGTNEVSAKDWGMYRQICNYTCLLIQNKKFKYLHDLWVLKSWWR